VIETVRSGENSFDSLIEQISTKGGTTEAGMNVLLSSNLDEILNQCLDSAYARVSGLKGN
jgi:pyrroline-5-carboxylate reductase